MKPVSFITAKSIAFDYIPESSLEADPMTSIYEQMEVQQLIIEGVLELESITEDSEEYLEEGANFQYFKAYRSGLKKYKKANKYAKKLLRAKQFNQARKSINDMVSACDDMEKAIRETESSALSTVIGTFVIGTATIVSLYLPMFNLIYGRADEIVDNSMRNSFITMTATKADGSNVVASISVEQLLNLPVSKALSKFLKVTMKGTQVFNIVKEVIHVIKSIKMIHQNLKNGEKTIDALNLYRNEILLSVQKIRKNIDKFKKLVDKKEQKANKKTERANNKDDDNEDELGPDPDFDFA